MGVGVGIRRGEDETWRECAKRYARSWNASLEEVVDKLYLHNIDQGDSPRKAAHNACYEWDVIELVEDGEFPEELPDWLEPPE